MCAFATAAGMFFWLCVRCFWGAWALGCYFVPFSGLRREREGDGGGKGETLAWKGPVGRSPSGSGSMWAGAPVWARFAGVSLSVFFWLGLASPVVEQQQTALFVSLGNQPPSSSRNK